MRNLVAEVSSHGPSRSYLIKSCIRAVTSCPFQRNLYAVQHWRGGMQNHCWGTALQAGRLRVRFPMILLEFFIDSNSSVCTMAVGLTQPVTDNEYQAYFLGGKGGQCGWQPYHTHVSDVLKSGTVSLLKPSGPVQSCTGIAGGNLPVMAFYTFNNALLPAEEIMMCTV
jgi:hypothetical protein